MDHKNVFEYGLKRGSERLAFDPEKRYAYVQHPVDGWRVYLRSAAFISIKGHPRNKFIIVKSVDKDAWEMPKGQMEGKDINLRDSILKLLYRNVKREIFEESGLSKIHNLKYTGKAFQDVEKNYPKDTYFQYHIFTGFITQEQYDKAKERFNWLKKNPEEFDKLTRDKKEKDDIALYKNDIKLRKGWAKHIIDLYFKKTGAAKATAKATAKTQKRKTIRRSRGGGCGCSSGNLRNSLPVPSQYKMF